MNDRRSEELGRGAGRQPGAVPRDLPDQQAGGADQDGDRWDTAIPEAPEAPDDGHRGDETVPEEPAD